MSDVVLFGTGPMAESYLQVFKGLNLSCVVIGRDAVKAERLADQFGFKGLGGGVSALDRIIGQGVKLVVISCAIDALEEVTLGCLQRGLKNILVEKPGALTVSGLKRIVGSVGDAEVRIAYNRRYYNSVRMLKSAVTKDGGVVGCSFDFTEREHNDVRGVVKSQEVKRKWGWSNSSHVLDTAFHVIGYPKTLHAQRSGTWDVHPSGTVFSGCGESTQGVQFSYLATWAGGGRWGVDVSTSAGRYRLCPLEELVFLPREKFQWVPLTPLDDDDKRYKPGLFKMVKAALAKNADDLPLLSEQIVLGEAVNRILGYDD